MQIQFNGAAGGITGSCHILQLNGYTVLLDCGLIQGRRKDEEQNRRPFPFAAQEISAVVLSHAHIDHSGRLPLLVKQGYQGPIYAQNATRDLCEILLQDSAYLQERDAQYENKWRKRKNQPSIEALYTVNAARRALSKMVGGLSAHGDVDDLMRCVRNFKNKPSVHVIHGEAEGKRDRVGFFDRLRRIVGPI